MPSSTSAPAETGAPMLTPLSELPECVRSFEFLLRGRRATSGFRDDPVPREVLDRALIFASEAPSGFNFQPWRFLVLQSPEQRARLRAAAMDQAKITEAPVVVVAMADREAWRESAEEILRARVEHTGVEAGDVEKQKRDAFAFIDRQSREVWLTRQVMIAFSYLMLAVESLGWDTAPMEGFDPEAVRRELELPDTVEIVALLAIGRGSDPAQLHPGRLPVHRIAYDEHHGVAWHLPPRRAGNPAHPPGLS
ncbi:MAG: nitroreductase family protein [Burkholderiales bacterium]|nr:nitroreductase family protein [Opitutaceae bacterium]